MHESLTCLLAAICSLSSSILFPRDLAFETKRLGSGGLSGCLRSLASAPALQPRFLLLSRRRLRLLPAGMVIHGEPGALAISAGIVMLVKENPVLVDAAALEKCYQVMDLLCEQCVKQQDMNEVLAMKMHYISCVLQKCLAFLQKRDDKLDALVKSLLKGRDSDGFPQYQEKFIRDCIRKFPYCEATLLQQLGNDPTAFSVLAQALTGQMAFVDADYCATCGDKGADKRCSLCKAVTYCSLTCQKLHWFTHKRMCRSLQEQDADLEKDTPRLKELKDDESDLVMETANFLQELCLRAEEKVAAAGGCPAELLACPSTSAEGPSCNQDGGRNNRGVLNDADDDDVERHG